MVLLLLCGMHPLFNVRLFIEAFLAALSYYVLHGWILR